MPTEIAPYRSVLYMPGSNQRALEKARTLAADALILDLEDAVSPDQKAAARDQVAATVAEGGFGARKVIVRINGLDTEWGAGDLAAALRARPDAILLPKVSIPEQLREIDKDIPQGVRLWAMMETPLGMQNAQAIAAATPRLQAFVLGTNDLLKDLNALPTPDRLALQPGLGLCMLAARAHGLICIDGVYNAFKDEDGLRAECIQGRTMGFDGKTLIHPSQIPLANQIFAPDAAAVDLAHAQVAAFEEAQAKGQGVAVLDGRIVENLHVETARRTLALAAAIDARNSEG
ncbi:HpcH/HpaI aldolase/citrate lyase family protein [Halovulum sp. GXIMD14793]